MKVVILAGGLGTRLTEETEIRPKPMVEIGGYPILWHIMKHYAHFGFDEFHIALGYKGEIIKRYFMDMMHLSGDLTIDLKQGDLTRITPHRENWTIHLHDTGQPTQTGGRVLRLKEHLKDEPFFLTYGDGVSTIDLRALSNFHKQNGATATISAVRPPSRFGGLSLDGDLVSVFEEKPQIGEGWINGGYMVLNPEALDLINGEMDSLERGALTILSKQGKLAAYRHDGFWQCMDTLRDKRYLESLWQKGNPEWKLWS